MARRVRNMSDSDALSIASDDVEGSDELEQLWSDAIAQCEHVERLHAQILSQTATLQHSLSDSLVVRHEGILQEFGDVLHAIHRTSLEQPDSDVGTLLRTMLETCEFVSSESKPLVSSLARDDRSPSA